MKKFSLILVLFFAATCVSATGWVYLGNYPYIYDAETSGWSYASAPVLWHQDVVSGEWKEIGEQPENFVPETLEGLTIILCEKSSCWEANYHGYRFLDDEMAEAWNYSAMIGGYTPDEDWLVLYSMIPTSCNQAMLISASLESEDGEEILNLEFTGENVGNFVGAISGVNRNGERILFDHWSGTFEISEGAPSLPGQ